jgi:hypothetical protein
MWTQRLIAYAVGIGLACLSAGSAMAQHPNGIPITLLKGQYQFNLNSTCILAATPPTFTAPPDLQPSPGAYSEVDQSYETGSITFDGLGNATSTNTGLTIASVAPAFNTPPYVVTYDQICRFRYVMKNISSFTLQNGSCSGTNTTGPTAFGVPGSTAKITGLTYEGHIGALGSVLTYGATMPSQSLLEVSNGFIATQLCGTQVTAVRKIRE